MVGIAQFALGAICTVVGVARCYLLSTFKWAHQYQIPAVGNTTGCGRYFSPERFQLLLITVAASFEYVRLIVDNLASGKIPDVPQHWIQIFGGSNALYFRLRVIRRWSLSFSIRRHPSRWSCVSHECPQLTEPGNPGTREKDLSSI